MNDEVEPKPGSTQDLSRRVGRLEERQSDLAATVARVELNQTHAEELSKLRFGSLDQAVATYAGKLEQFMARIEGLLTGETEMPRTRDIMKDWADWRKDVDADREKGNTFFSQSRLVIAAVIAAPGYIGLAIALYGLMGPHK